MESTSRVGKLVEIVVLDLWCPRHCGCFTVEMVFHRGAENSKFSLLVGDFDVRAFPTRSCCHVDASIEQVSADHPEQALIMMNEVIQHLD